MVQSAIQTYSLWPKRHRIIKNPTGELLTSVGGSSLYFFQENKMKLNDLPIISDLITENGSEVKVLFVKATNSTTRLDVSMGLSFANDRGVVFDKAFIEETYAELGMFKSNSDKEHLFWALQAENYSPKGEAKDLILSKGLRHTSMSVGDILVINGVYHLVDIFGFSELNI